LGRDLNEANHSEITTMKRATRRLACGAAALLPLLSSCGPHQGMIAHSVVREVRQRCHPVTPCSIQLRHLTPFDWDKGFYFNDATTEEERTRTLGVKDENYQEMEDQYVFLKNGKVVHQENEPTNVEGNLPDEIGIVTPEGQNIASFESNATFTVSWESGSNGPWFLLHPAH